MESNTKNRSRQIAVTAIMSALALVGNYVLVTIPNVELASAVLFVTSYLFGLQIAVWCVLIVSLIYAILNPWGPFIIEVWTSQLIGWIFIVCVGALMDRRRRDGKWSQYQLIELAITGALATLFFDLITTLGYSLWSGLPYSLTLVTGLGFFAIHMLSNAIIFPAIIPKLDTAMRSQLDTYFNRKRLPG